MGASLRTRSRGRGGEAWAAAANEATKRPRKPFDSEGVAAQEGCKDAVAGIAAPGRLWGMLAADEAVGREDERCRRCIRGQWTTREGCHFSFIHVAAERLEMLFADEAAREDGSEWGL